MVDSQYKFVIAKLDAYQGTWPDLSKATGISVSTLRKIHSKVVKNPGVLHIETLFKHFIEQAALAR